jgi:Peptidase family M23
MFTTFFLLACTDDGGRTSGEAGTQSTTQLSTDGGGPFTSDTGTGTGTGSDEPLPRAELQLRLPVLDPSQVMPGAENPGMDHDPAVGAPCLDYAAFSHPWCFDEHLGTDYTLLGGFHAMNAQLGEVVAAADGVVTEVVDGNYDRCHLGDKGQVDCDGYPIASNYVVIVHDTAEKTEYWHLAIGIEVLPGQSVTAGQVIGRMGSSGASLEPNVHFELQNVYGDRIDPYAGPYSQPETYWCEQGDHGDLPSTECP